MLEVLCFLLGCGLTAVVFNVRQRSAHTAKKRADETQYKDLWIQTLDLMAFNGQLTDEQLAAIKPQAAAAPKPSVRPLPQGTGFSSDRREIEIARARKGLPPADNLEGMFSSDVRKVQEARINHGTAT